MPTTSRIDVIHGQQWNAVYEGEHQPGPTYRILPDSKTQQAERENLSDKAVAGEVYRRLGISPRKVTIYYYGDQLRGASFAMVFGDGVYIMIQLKDGHPVKE